jgi:hypothetical protein
MVRTVNEYMRNTALNASDFFSNEGGIGKPPFHQNQFGANAGGPLVIPHIYNGHDKTFWFLSYEGFRLREGETFTETVPTQAERGGDFSAAGTPIYNPLTVCGEFSNAPCAVGSNGQPVYTRQLFAGNLIPSTAINPTSVALLRLWPLPNQAGLVNNYTSDTNAGGNNSEVVTRVDQNVSDKQRIFGRFSYWNNMVLPVDPLHTGVCVDSCTDNFNVYNFVIDDSYAFSPTTAGDFHASIDRFDYNRSPLHTRVDLTTVGWPSSYNAAIPAAVRTVPTPTVVGYADSVFGSGGLGSAIVGRENDYDFDASVTKIAGRHSVNFGGDFRVIQHNYGQTNNASGAFTFDSGFTASAPFSAGTGGNAFASYLLGYPSSGGNTIPAFVAAQQTYRALWAQDTWKVTNKLTLDLGLHYEIDGPWSERFNRLSFWNLKAPFPLAQQVGMPNLKGTLGLVATPERPSRNPVNFDYTQFAPRVGFAYMLNQKTVVRGGYGIFWIPPNLELEASPDHDILNAISTSFVSSINGGVTPFSSFSNPFPNGILEPPGHNPSFLPSLYGQGPVESYPNNPYGYIQQWNIDVQRQLPAGLFADFAYAGSAGIHLPGFAQSVNPLPDRFLSMGQALETSTANPFASVFPATSPLASATVPASQLLRPYPQWSDVWLAGEGYGNSAYSSFQAKLQKNFKGGGTLLVAYTNSKLMSVGVSTLTPWLEANGGPSGVVDWNNREESRSLASYDVPQRLVLSYVLNLPFGYGRRYASGLTGVAGKLVSGWGVDGITTFQRGFPLQLGTSLGLVGPYDSAATPNRTCSNPALGGSVESRLNRWFNTSCFAQPSPFTYGTESPDDPTLREQGINNFDFALFKNINFGPGEKLGLQFRAEFFDLFNTPQFGPPNTTCCSNPSSPAFNPSFGVVSSQINNPRLIQFALKFLF